MKFICIIIAIYTIPGPKKQKQSSWTKGRTVPDRRKSGMRSIQKCSFCRKKGYNSETAGWIPHFSIVNCPFKTAVFTADLQNVCDSSIEM